MSRRRRRERRHTKLKNQLLLALPQYILSFRNDIGYPVIYITKLLARIQKYYPEMYFVDSVILIELLKKVEKKGHVVLSTDVISINVIHTLSCKPIRLDKYSGIYSWEILVEEQFPAVYCKKKTPCQYCGVQLWEFEHNGLCCSSGKLLNLKAITIDNCHPMYDFYFGGSDVSKQLMNHPNAYNNQFALSSYGFNGIPKHLHVRGLNVFTIMGQMHHRYQPSSRGTLSHFEGLVYDPYHVKRELMSPVLKRTVVQAIANVLNECNFLFKHIITKYEEHKNDDNLTDLNIVLLDKTTSSERHHSTVALPTTEEIAVLVQPASETLNSTLYNRSIAFKLKPFVGSDEAQRLRLKKILRDDSLIHENSQLYNVQRDHPVADALGFPLIHIDGQNGWYRNMCVKSGREEDNGKMIKVSQPDWYRRQAIQRPGEINVALHMKKLTQKYFCVSYISCEDYRLTYIRNHQKKMRVEKYKEVKKYLANKAMTSTGQPIILPGSFTGGPKWYKKRTLEAIALVLGMGKPDLFITFTGMY